MVFVLGMLVGGVIIYYVWQRKYQDISQSEQALRRRLAESDNEARQLKAQLEQMGQQDDQAAAYQKEVQMKTEELQNVTEQLSAAEAEINSLREQLAAAEARAASAAAPSAPAPAEEEPQPLEAAAEAAPPEEPAEEEPQPPEAAAEAAPPETTEEAQETVVAEPDDLSRIEGIGPKAAQVLNENGIRSFAQLAQTSVEQLREILQAAGPVFKRMEPASWPKQADLAAKGDWDALKTLQDELDGGRYRE